MKRRSSSSAWTRTLQRSFAAMAKTAARSGRQALKQTLPGFLKPKPRARPKLSARNLAAGGGAWTAGLALAKTGVRRFHLYVPPGLQVGERLPLMVMLHGCGQDAAAFATSTRMNGIALRERFVVLYPEQDRMANVQGCWNWFDTDHGRAQAEAASILKAIDQVCLHHAVDRNRVAIAGLSAGASMAALLATQHPARFNAVVMHSGVPPGTAHCAVSALGAMRGRRLPPRATPPATPSAQQDAWPPLLVIHGEADGVVSPLNGQAAAQTWADAASAHKQATRTVQRGQRHPMAVTDFKRRGQTVVTLVVVQSLAHAWSGGAAGQPYGDAKGPDASRMAWAFASRQFSGP